jgi:hypothetical protein
MFKAGRSRLRPHLQNLLYLIDMVQFLGVIGNTRWARIERWNFGSFPERGGP